MLEPRKLMPFSIEYRKAPTAVITEITENTPMVMPSIVNTERSLFAPRDDHAIFMISPNNIFKNPKFEYRNPKQTVQNTNIETTRLFAFPEYSTIRYSLAPLPRMRVACVAVRVCHRHQASAANSKFPLLIFGKS